MQITKIADGDERTRPGEVSMRQSRDGDSN